MRDPIQIALIAAALGLMLLWFLNMPPVPPPEATPSESAPSLAPPELPTAQGESPTPLAPAAESPAAAGAKPPAQMTQSEKVQLANDAVRLVVSNIGGRVESIELLNYNDRIGSDSGPVQLVTAPKQGTLTLLLGEGPFAATASAPHEVVDSGPRSVTLVLESEGLEIRRVVTLDDAGYGGELRVAVSNRGTAVVQPSYALAMYGRERESAAPDRFQNYQLVASVDGDLERRLVGGIHSPGFLDGLMGGGNDPHRTFEANVEWAGVESQYFLLAAIASNPGDASAVQAPVAPDTGLSLLRYPVFEVPPGTQIERSYRLYFGPKLRAEVPELLLPAVHIGWDWVRPIVDGFAVALVWFHDNLVGNYGVAIIVLTILLRLGTYPLTQKSMSSMKRLGDIAPMMKELQEKHGDDKEKLSAEMMSLYKNKGINPVSAMGGGCLPMLIQMPFMIALYFALQGSIELRHAPFALWIQDLSAPAQLFAVAGFPIRPLPLLMGASMLLQQRLTPTTGDPQQRQMMMWMSVIFTFMFYQFPSGLLLYWFVSNLLGIAQQLLVNRPRAEAAKQK